MGRQRRVIHELDAYPRDPKFRVQETYRFEEVVFAGMFPPFAPYGDSAITQEQGEALIERAYARFAPARQRPALRLVKYRRKYREGTAHYRVTHHDIWSPLGVMDEGILLHEIAHSLTWKQTWTGHGPQFLRCLIELNCWRLKMNVEERVKLARLHGMEVSDRLMLGHDPTNVRWILKPK